MSTLVYAGRTVEEQGVPWFIEALAGLVPAEVLAAHAVFLTFTTETTGVVTRITEQVLLTWAFGALVAMSILLYLIRALVRGWKKWDGVRILVPPLAFVTWTMLQRSTAFDAVWPDLRMPTRLLVGMILAIVLIAAATALGLKNATRKK